MTLLLLLLLFTDQEASPPDPGGGGGGYLPGYNPGGGMGTAGSRKAKHFGQLIDEALRTPTTKKSKTKAERVAAAEIERLLRTLPTVRRGAEAEVVPIRTRARLARHRASGGATVQPIPVDTVAVCPAVAPTGAAVAGPSAAWTMARVVTVPAGGIHNPTDEDLSHIADQLHQSQETSRTT